MNGSSESLISQSSSFRDGTTMEREGAVRQIARGLGINVTPLYGGTTNRNGECDGTECFINMNSTRVNGGNFYDIGLIAIHEKYHLDNQYTTGSLTPESDAYNAMMQHSYFDGYKNIYPEIRKAYISSEYGSASADYEMNYIPYWVIQGDSIYLIGISLNTDRGQIVDGEIIYPDFRLPIERFLRMEKLVKKKFEKTEEPMVDIEGMSSMFSCGRMFASWVSGVYYIKLVMEFDYDIDTWKKEPILKLTIKDGTIIKTEKI